MFLDDEIAAARTRRNEARSGLYLAMGALAACVLMMLALTAQAAESKPQRPALGLSISSVSR